MNIQYLDSAIRAVCPIDGVNSDRVIAFRPEATQQEIEAAQIIADKWDFSVKAKDEKRQDIEAQRDAAISAGCPHKGKLYPFDDVMISAILGRVVRWREGRIPVDAKLPVRLKDNSIELLSRDEHLDLADALSAHGEAIYAASWAAKDAL